jgi:GR25 family glycosyltransferase involved in LPS biosynthesis
MPSVQIVVICGNEKRKAFQQQMFRDLNITHPVFFLKACTPDNSQDYMVDQDDTYPEEPPVLCCTRSHGAALQYYVDNCIERDYVLIVEDDVTLLEKDFQTKLDNVIRLYEKHESELDFISIAFLPKDEFTSHSKDDVLQWNMTCTVWGTQAYLVSRKNAIRMANIFHKPTSKDLRTTLQDLRKTINNGAGHANKVLRLQADVVLSFFFRQAIVTPMMGIEMPFESMIRANTVLHHAAWKNYKSVNPDDYYSKPWTG